jgi:hypothetical protein
LADAVRWTARVAIPAGLITALWTWARAVSISADGAHYMELAAQSWQRGPAAGMDWYAGPGYPALAGCLYGLTGDLEFAGRLASFLFGLSLLVGVWVLARLLFDRSVAQLAAALVALHPRFVERCVMAETDVAYASWLVWSLVAAWKLRHAGSWARGLGAGAALGSTLGIAYLTRPEAVPLAGLLAIWLLWPQRSHTDSPAVTFWRRRAAALVLAGGLAAAIAWPYVWHLRQELGRWSLSGKDRSLTLKFVPDKRNYESALATGVVGALLRDPIDLLDWLPYHLWWGTPQLAKALSPLHLLMGLYALARRRSIARRPGSLSLLLGTSVPFLGFFMLTFPGERYFMQAMPAWSILAAAGGVRFASALAARRCRRATALPREGSPADQPLHERLLFTRWTRGAIAVPVTLLGLCTWADHIEPLGQSRLTERHIGERILAIGGPGRRVLSFTIAAFYARGERVPRWGPMQGIVRCHGYGREFSYDDMLAYVRRHRAEFVVVDHDFRKDCPEFTQRVRAEDFTRVAEVPSRHEPTLVYRYVGPRGASAE